MDKQQELEKIAQTSAAVNQLEMQIHEHRIRVETIRNETERINSETNAMRERKLNLNVQNEALKRKLLEKKKIEARQQTRLAMQEMSLKYQRTLLEKDIKAREEKKKKYKETIRIEWLDVEHYRKRLEKMDISYQQLKQSGIGLMKAEIEYNDLLVKTARIKKIQNEKVQLEKRLFYSKIVQFAEFYLLYQEYEAKMAKLSELKLKETDLLKKHLDEQEKNKKKKMIQFQVKEDIFEMEALIKTKFEAFTSSFNPVVEFSGVRSKVRILDVKTVAPPTVPVSKAAPVPKEVFEQIEQFIQKAEISAPILKSTTISPNKSCSINTKLIKPKAQFSQSNKKLSQTFLLSKVDEKAKVFNELSQSDGLISSGTNTASQNTRDACTIEISPMELQTPEKDKYFGTTSGTVGNVGKSNFLNLVSSSTNYRDQLEFDNDNLTDLFEANYLNQTEQMGDSNDNERNKNEISFGFGGGFSF